MEHCAAYFGMKSLYPADSSAIEQFHISVKLSPAVHLAFSTLSQLNLEHSSPFHPCLLVTNYFSFHEKNNAFERL